MQRKLTEAFNKHVGKQVLHPMAMGICQVTEEVANEAKTLGLRLRVLYPNSRVTMDFSEQRINMHVEVDGAGQHYVKSFGVG